MYKYENGEKMENMVKDYRITGSHRFGTWCKMCKKC